MKNTKLSNHSPNKAAFTLVELSMVITIIGLLVATVASSYKLIERAKLKAVVSEIMQIDTAFRTFQQTYNAFPGDMANAYDFFSGKDCGVASESGATQEQRCNGNGNLEITAAAAIGRVCEEKHNVWNHMNYADILKAAPSSCAPIFYSHKYKQLSYSIMTGSVDSNAYINNGAIVPVIRLGKIRADKIASDSYNTNINNGKLITPLQAKIIDRKLDDEFAYSGKVQGVNGYDDSSSKDGNCSSDTFNATNSTDYIVANDSPECVLYYVLDQII